VLDDHADVDRRILYVYALFSEAVFDGLSNGAAGGPTWMAMNSRTAAVVLWLAGCLTIAIGCLIVKVTIWGLSLLPARDRMAASPPPVAVPEERPAPVPVA
jgi:hypothetical protein